MHVRPNRDYELASDQVGAARTSAPNKSAAIAPDSKTIVEFQCDFIGASLSVPPRLVWSPGAERCGINLNTRLSSAM